MYLRLQWTSSVFQLCKLTRDCQWKTNGRYHQPVWFQWSMSSGIPMYWERLVRRSLAQVTTQHATPMYTTGMVRLVWAKLIQFVLQPQMHKNYTGAYIQGMHRVMLKYSHVWRVELVCLESSKLHVKAEYTKTCPLPAWCPAILPFQTSTGAILFDYMCLVCVGALTVPPVVFQCSLQ